MFWAVWSFIKKRRGFLDSRMLTLRAARGRREAAPHDGPAIRRAPFFHKISLVFGSRLRSSIAADVATMILRGKKFQIHDLPLLVI
jgi:hypothetical protein